MNFVVLRDETGFNSTTLFEVMGCIQMDKAEGNATVISVRWFLASDYSTWLHSAVPLYVFRNPTPKYRAKEVTPTSSLLRLVPSLPSVTQR